MTRVICPYQGWPAPNLINFAGKIDILIKVKFKYNKLIHIILNNILNTLNNR